MKNWLSKNWKNVLLVIFVLFSLDKCTQSCSRSTKINKLELESSHKDSVIMENNDSIKALNTSIATLQAKLEGYGMTLEMQKDALNKISDVKKNINVTVKSKH